MEKHWVILVDDDEDDRFLVQQAFRPQRTRCLLQALASGQELFPLLAEAVVLPALLLLDINMPLMDGFEVLGRLRAHRQYQSIPVVILTTSASATDQQRALALGANGFVTKPATLDELIDVVAQLQQDWFDRS